MHRRAFLKSTGALPLWLARTLSAAPGENRKKILIAIFQRGAVDGLNMVVPHGEKQYYSLRPNIAIEKPLDLDGFFGFHPSLEPLMTPWKDGKLAVVHAAGSPDPTRSHFDAQDYMESGTPGLKSTPDGWLNRAIPLGPAPSPVRAVSLGAALPRTLRGKREAIAITNLRSFRVADPGFEKMYASSADSMLKDAGKSTFEALKVVKNVQNGAYLASNGAVYPPSRFGQSMQEIARLIKADVGLEVAFADMGGWDTHVNELPQLQNLLRDFGSALGAFYRDLDKRMEDITIVTMSEFGRTARENGNRGTDHGHANAMLVLGGDVKGGKVYGDWPGLGSEQLYENRDLAVTTDFRDVLSELIAKQLGAKGSVFPGYDKPKFRGLIA
jgi:uncharacterized protein (DUF1501 family)